jgi:hypothetical protein
MMRSEKNRAVKRICKDIRKLDNTIVQRNYLQIKQDVQDIIQSEMAWLLNNPGLVHLIVRKG